MATTARLLLSLIAVLSIAACSLLGFAPANPCTGGVCMADLTVPTAQSCDTGVLKVVPDPIKVPEPNNIQWTIATPGYKFAANGIVVQGTGFQTHVTGSGNKFIVHDDWTDARANIKYTVNLVKEGTGGIPDRLCTPYDPFISNR